MRCRISKEPVYRRQGTIFTQELDRTNATGLYPSMKYPGYTGGGYINPKGRRVALAKRGKFRRIRAFAV